MIDFGSINPRKDQSVYTFGYIRKPTGSDRLQLYQLKTNIVCLIPNSDHDLLVEFTIDQLGILAEYGQRLGSRPSPPLVAHFIGNSGDHVLSRIAKT